MGNLKYLHIIRGFAAFYVALGHAKVIFWVGGRQYMEKFSRATWDFNDHLAFATDMFSSSAQEFVIVFFVLSGFFINHSFTINKWRMRDFYSARAIRIYLPYIASVFFALLVFLLISIINPVIFSGDLTRVIDQRIVASYNELDISSFLLSVLFLPKADYIACNFAYWSLFHEAVFYLLLPLIIRSKKSFYLVSLFLFLASNLFKLNPPYLITDFLFKYSIFFAFGFFLYDKVSTVNLNKLFIPYYLSYIFLLILFIVVIISGVLEIKPYSEVLAAVFTAFAIITIMNHAMKENKVTVFLMRLGDISYSLYVFHLPFYFLCYAILTSVTGRYTYYSRIYWFFIPLVLLFSYGMWRLIERPSLILIKKYKASHLLNKKISI